MGRKELEPRAARGLSIAARRKISFGVDHHLVPSDSTPGAAYRVVGRGDDPKDTCSCPDFEKHRIKCKHQWAVYFALRPELLQEMAEHNEHGSGRHLVAEPKNMVALINAVGDAVDHWWPAPSTRRPGRPHHVLRDVITTGLVRAWFKTAARQTEGFIKLVSDREVLRVRPVSYNSFYDQMKVDLLPKIGRLLLLTAKPLAPIETVFCLDATGFGHELYFHYADHQWGKDRKRCEKHQDDYRNRFVHACEDCAKANDGQGGKRRSWDKVHIICGKESQIIAAIAISRRHESKFFKPLVEGVHENFNLRTIAGDKAYCTREAIEYLAQIGVGSAIPFWDNFQPGRGSSAVWRQGHADFLRRQGPEFDSEYYAPRSQVESTFSNVKRTENHRLRARKVVTRANEAAFLFLLHNLRVLSRMKEERALDIQLQTSSVGE